MLVWKAHSQKIEALAFSPCGRTLALAGSYLACRLIDAATGKWQWTLSGTHGQSLAFLPSGSVLCKNGSVSIRESQTGNEIRKFGHWCRAFGLAPDGRAVFVADGDHQDLIRRYNLEGSSVYQTDELESGAINRVAVSPDGRLVAVVGRRRFYLLTTDPLSVLTSDAQRGLSTGAFALAFSPCGQRLVFSAGRTLFVWDTAARQEINRVQLDVKHFMDAAFTPDGKRLITVSKEGAARMWDTATWSCERAFAWDVGPLRAVAVSPDGTRAATAGDSGRVVVWDLDE